MFKGHKVKYSNCNNSAADCSISLKFRTQFDRGEACMLKVKGQSSRSRGLVACFRAVADMDVADVVSGRYGVTLFVPIMVSVWRYMVVVDRWPISTSFVTS